MPSGPETPSRRKRVDHTQGEAAWNGRGGPGPLTKERAAEKGRSPGPGVGRGDGPGRSLWGGPWARGGVGAGVVASLSRWPAEDSCPGSLY